MKKKSEELATQLAAKREAAAPLLAKKEGRTPEEIAQAKTLMTEIKSLNEQYKGALDQEELDAAAAENDAELKRLKDPVNPIVHPNPTDDSKKRVQIYHRHSRLKNLVSDEQAFRFGNWFIAGPLGMTGAGAGDAPMVKRATKYCEDHGISLKAEIKAQAENVNSAGGALVPEEFSTQLIDLREKYGVFRRNAKIVPMGTDSKLIPRRTGGLTAYFLTDNDGLTESTKNWDNVNLIAKKIGVLAKYSSEISEDAIINMADDLAGEIAYAFAQLEDACGFVGDGTSQYGGITGVSTALYPKLGATVANIAGLQLATGTGYGTNWNSIVLGDFNNVVGKLPEYADTPNARWFVSRTFWASVMQRLALAAGGVTAEEVEGKRQRTFLGYPVEVTQKMPKVSAINQVCALFGDLSLASKLGNRRETTIAMSEHYLFGNDELAIRGTERCDIVVHDVGNYTATVASQVPGPIVGLITAAS